MEDCALGAEASSWVKVFGLRLWGIVQEFRLRAEVLGSGKWVLGFEAKGCRIVTSLHCGFIQFSPFCPNY